MASSQIVVWTESVDGPRFPLDEDGIERAGGRIRRVACRDMAERIDAVRDADVMVVRNAQITEAFCAAVPRLVGMVRTGIGLDTIDIPAATRHGICVAHVPDFCYDDVADAAWTLILALERKVRQADRLVRDGIWEQNILLPMHRLRGRLLGLVGFGNIARRVADRGRAFGLGVLAADPYLDESAMAAAGAEKVSLEDLFSRADIISLHTPLTAETRGMIGASLLARMKPGAIVINTSRGPVIDEPALIDALRAGRIGGAGLDVLAKEPPAKDHPMFHMDNVVLSPHAASTTVEALDELAVKVSRQIVQFLRGEWPTYLANPAVRDQTNCRLLAARRSA